MPTVKISVLQGDLQITNASGTAHYASPTANLPAAVLALSGPLVFMINQDVPGVIGHVGTVLGRNAINIANFSLGRRDAPLAPGDPLEALALVATDELVSESVLEELRQNPAAKIARSVDFHQ